MSDRRSGPYALTGRSGWDVLKEAESPPGKMWLKVDGRGPLSFVLLRAEPFVYYGHFVRGKMRPCVNPDRCLECAQGNGKKPRAVFSGMDSHTRACGLIEVGKETALEILRHCEDAGTARGLVLLLRKAGGRVNGAIQVVGTHSMVDPESLPEGPDAGEVLRRQWSEPERIS